MRRALICVISSCCLLMCGCNASPDQSKRTSITLTDFIQATGRNITIEGKVGFYPVQEQWLDCGTFMVEIKDSPLPRSVLDKNIRATGIAEVSYGEITPEFRASLTNDRFRAALGADKVGKFTNCVLTLKTWEELK